MTGITFETVAQDVASRSLQVTVDTERLAETERRAVREYAQQVRLPGFRKGRAPEPVVRRRFEQQIRQYVLEDSLRESWTTILKETEFKPTGEPQIRNVTYQTGQPLKFDLLIEIRPEITLERTGGFTLIRREEPVTDANVREQLEHLREQHGTWTPVEGVRPESGQLVSVTAAPLVDGAVTGQAQPHDIVLGRDEAVPDLEARVMQLLPGESVDADVELATSDSSGNPRETRHVRITLHEIKARALPALDDALARELGDFESLADLEAAIRQDLIVDAGRRAETQVRSELIQQLAEANAVPAPPSLVHRLIRAYTEDLRIPEEQFESIAGSFRAVAETGVKRELIIDSVAAAQNLRATEADLDVKIGEMAGARGVDPGKLYTTLQQQHRLGELEHAVTEEKVFAWLLSQSTVTEGAPS